MEYYSSSNNYNEYHDNYQYHQPYNYNSHDELRYVQNYNYNYNNNSYINNSYELTPTKSLVGYYYSNYSGNNNNNNNNDNNYNYNDYGYSNNDVNQHDFFASKNANYSKNGEYFYDPVTTRFIISYSNNNNASNEIDDDLHFEEYDPEPFVGGYDICATYGKPLPPSNDICYKVIDTNDVGPSGDKPVATGQNDNNVGGLGPNLNMNSNSVLEGSVADSEDEEEDVATGQNDNVGGLGPNLNLDSNSVLEGSVADSEDEDEDEEEDNVGPQVAQEVVDSKAEGTGEKNEGKIEGDEVKIRRQIPPGYGIEAIGICDGLFGGYFPCLSKKNHINCYECGSEVKSKVVDDNYECWQGTVDYLFGNPNPYGGAMPEKGSYGDPVYAYQRHCPQMTVVGKFVNEETSSSVYSSGYNYGYNGDY